MRDKWQNPMGSPPSADELTESAWRTRIYEGVRQTVADLGALEARITDLEGDQTALLTAVQDVNQSIADLKQTILDLHAGDVLEQDTINTLTTRVEAVDAQAEAALLALAPVEVPEPEPIPTPGEGEGEPTP